MHRKIIVFLITVTLALAFLLAYIFFTRNEDIQAFKDAQFNTSNQMGGDPSAQLISFSSNLTESDLIDGEKYGDFIFRANHPDDRGYNGFYGRFSGESIIRGVVYVETETMNVWVYVDEESVRKLPQFYFSKIYDYVRPSRGYNILSFGYEYFFGVDQDKLKIKMDQLRTLNGEEVELKIGNYIFVSNEKASGPHATLLEIIYPTP